MRITTSKRLFLRNRCGEATAHHHSALSLFFVTFATRTPLIGLAPTKPSKVFIFAFVALPDADPRDQPSTPPYHQPKVMTLIPVSISLRSRPLSVTRLPASSGAMRSNPIW